MITATKRWLRRNRTGFAVGFGVVGVGYIAGQYVISKITEARELMASDRLAKENLQRRFQQNQKDCTFTVLELLPTVTDNILGALPSEKITEELQKKKAERLGRNTGAFELTPSESSVAPSVADDEGRSASSESYIHASQTVSSSSSDKESKPPRTKAQLWNDLKISSVTRAITLTYTISLLTLLTRLQFNLLGRKNYLSSVVSQVTLASQSPNISLENREDGDSARHLHDKDFETNRDYLTFSWWLLHRGWREVMSNVETAVKEVFGPLKPTEDVTLETLSHLILEVRKRVEGATSGERSARKWLPYLLPPRDEEAIVLRDSGVAKPPRALSEETGTSALPPSASSSHVPGDSLSPALRQLLDETADLIDSPLFTHVLTLVLDATFSQLMDQKRRSEAYKLHDMPTNPPIQVAGAPTESELKSAKLATILAVMTREAHNMSNRVPNEYVQAIEGVTDLEAFAAVIYSSNFDLVLSSNDLQSVANISSQHLPENDADLDTRHQSSLPYVDTAAGAIGGAWTVFEKIWTRLAGS